MPKILDGIKRIFANSDTKPLEKAASLWQQRIVSANKYFEDWERRFKCKTLEDYYEGKQWKENDRYEPYVVNLVYSSIQVKQPSLLFSKPQFHLKSRPGKADFNSQEAFAAAQLQEDTLNSIVSDSLTNFAAEVHMSILDSWFYFGIIEVGYSADWINNPNAGKPILKSDYNVDEDKEDANEVREPDKLPEKEWIYTKRIPAHTFRVGGIDSVFLGRNNWVGYYEYVRTQDLLAAGVDKDKLEFAGSHSQEFFSGANVKNDIERSGDLVKIWKIWDLRAKEKLIYKDSPSNLLFPAESFKRLPLFDLRFAPRRKGFYPMPPVFNWKSPQDEINESHEMNRSHRRKARSLYQVQQQLVDEEELEKMMTAPDMTCIIVKKDDAIKPIQNPSVDGSLGIALQVAKDDYNIVSATSADQQGAADRETATAANIKSQVGQVRSTADQAIVAIWLCAIGKEILLQAREKLTLPFWISSNIDIVKGPDEVSDISNNYKLIEAEDLGDGDFNVEISIESLSPVSNEDEKKKFLEFLAIITQYPLLAVNPDLIFEAAYRVGYRNRKVITQLVKVAQLQLMIQQSALTAQAAQSGMQPQNSGAPGAGQAAQNSVQNQTPPMLNQIQQQIGQQLQ